MQKLTFGEALEVLKQGKSVIREHEKGKSKINIENYSNYNSPMLVFTILHDNRKIKWLPDLEELLATDWVIVDE